MKVSPSVCLKDAIPVPDTGPDFAVSTLVLKRQPRGSSSKAGAHLIQINTAYWQMKRPIHVEYPAYNNDPEIGQVVIPKRLGHFLVMVSHEVSHHLQFLYGPMYASKIKDYWRKPHGRGFKYIYRILRRDLVNPMILDMQTEHRLAQYKKAA